MTDLPSYWGILPANVRYDDRLSPMAKIMYVEFTALTQKNGTAHAANAYFAELYHVEPTTVSAWVAELVKSGHIKVSYAKGNRRIVRLAKAPLREKPKTSSGKAEDPLREKPKAILIGQDEQDKMNTNVCSENDEADSGYSEAFDTFWKTYPRRIDKKRAHRCWLATQKRGADAGQLQAAAAHYAKACASARTEERFIKHPSTFLGPDESWRDFVASSTPDAPAGAVVKAVKTVECPQGHTMEIGGICRVCGYDARNQG